MKPTKQQAICLKLAQWLGKPEPEIHELEVGLHKVTYDNGKWPRLVFDPFDSVEKGRAQFAECVIKALCLGLIRIDGSSVKMMVPKYASFTYFGEQDSLPGTILEAIYYAIDGTDTWSGI